MGPRLGFQRESLRKTNCSVFETGENVREKLEGQNRFSASSYVFALVQSFHAFQSEQSFFFRFVSPGLGLNIEGV